jgi:pyrroloquinoline quinone biosynthesis protein B
MFCNGYGDKEKEMIYISLLTLIFTLPMQRDPVLNDQQAPFLIILGTIQDGGSPHIGCDKACCRELFRNPDPNRQVVSLGLVDPLNSKNFLFEATPDFTSQLKELKKHSPFSAGETADAIFLTHAHIGHYTGLMYLGREAFNAAEIAVYAMPRMKTFLQQNGPWSQLVHLKNISIREMQNEKEITLTSQLSVTPFIVPHRDEYSETVGFKITGPHKSALFIPDINKWSQWKKDIKKEILKVDYAFLDASFYDAEEINYRDISEIPHPFMIETMELFNDLEEQQKAKVCFIHFNHSNPVLKENSSQAQTVKNRGFNISQIYEVFNL